MYKTCSCIFAQRLKAKLGSCMLRFFLSSLDHTLDHYPLCITCHFYWHTLCLVLLFKHDFSQNCSHFTRNVPYWDPSKQPNLNGKKYQLGTRLLETTSNVSISDVHNKPERVCRVKLYTNSYMCLNATLGIVVLHARKIRMWHSNIRENNIDWEISIVGSPWQIESTQANT
jgi:hypothetical protein